MRWPRVTLLILLLLAVAAGIVALGLTDVERPVISTERSLDLPARALEPAPLGGDVDFVSPAPAPDLAPDLAPTDGVETGVESGAE